MNVIDAIRNRRSVRAYLGKPLPAEVLARMREALRLAPSACNYQPWRFLFVADAGLRREIARVANGQSWMADAPLTIVACGCPDQAYARMGGDGNSADIDVAIGLDHLTLAAVAEGLGTCWIGAFREPEMKRLLDIPDTVKVVALTPLGYPASAGLNHPCGQADRKPESEIFCMDRFGNFE